MCDPNWRGATYRSTFYNALTLAERLSFCEEMARNVWIGSDATITSCSAANRADAPFSVFSTSEYVEFSSDLA